MNKRIRNISIIIAIIAIVFTATFFVNKNASKETKVSKAPFMLPGEFQNTYNDQGGLRMIGGSPITDSSAAAQIKTKFDNKTNNNYDYDYYNIIKLEVKANTAVSNLSGVSIKDENGSNASVPYYYEYSKNGEVLSGSSEDNSNLLGSIPINSTINFYIIPTSDTKGGIYSLNLNLDNNSATNAYARFCLYNVFYDEGDNGDVFVRTINSYMSSFTLDTPSFANTSNFNGWSNVSANSSTVKYQDKQTFTGGDFENFLINDNTNNYDYTINLFPVYGSGPTRGVDYTVKFNNGGANGVISGKTALDNVTVSSTGSITLPENPYYKTGFNFGNWALDTSDTTTYFDENESVNITDIPSSFIVNNEITIFAKWNPITYTIHYNANGGSGTVQDSTFTFETSKVTLRGNQFTRDNYNFVGWSKNNNAQPGDNGIYNSTKRPSPSDLGANDVTLYAIWQSSAPVIPNYVIRFDANGGLGVMDADTVASNESYTLPDCEFTRNGFTFDKWSYNGNTYRAGQTIDLSDLTVTDNKITFSAVWQSNDTGYVLNFDPNGGTGETMGSLNYIVGGTPITVPRCTYTRVGYKFVGWATSPDGDGDPDYAVNTSVTLSKNVTLYALWAPISYYIVYDSNATYGEAGGNVSGNMEDTEAFYDENIKLRKNSFVHNDSNFIFAGWSTTPDGDVSYVDEAVVSNLASEQDDEIILYAIWLEKKTVKIKFNNNGGTGSMNEVDTMTFTDITLPKNTFKRVGFNFMGWATEENGSVVYRDGEKINLRSVSGDSLVLYSVWKPTGTTPTGTTSNNVSKAITSNPVTGGSLLVVFLAIGSAIGAKFIHSRRKGF